MTADIPGLILNCRERADELKAEALANGGESAAEKMQDSTRLLTLCEALDAERFAHGQTRQELDALVSVVASIAANIAVRINGRIVWKTNTEVPRYKVDAMTFDTAEQAIRAALSAPAGDTEAKGE